MKTDYAKILDVFETVCQLYEYSVRKTFAAGALVGLEIARDGQRLAFNPKTGELLGVL